MHLICTSVACYLGYLAHRYEETSEERVQNLLKKYKHAPRQWAELPKRDHESGTALLACHFLSYTDTMYSVLHLQVTVC